MIIALGGLPGSGKSTISRHLEQKFNLKRYNMGELRRKMAVERGMTLDELNQLGEKEKWTDYGVDEYQKALGKKEDNFVIDGRLSWFFIPNSIKVFLTIDPKIGAKRIFEAKRESERQYESAEDTEAQINARLASDNKRYAQLYGVDPYDAKNHDIIIDTSNLSEEEMKEKIEEAINNLGASLVD